MPSPSLAQLGEISKAGGPFDLTAYRERRARRKMRQIQRRGAISDAVGHRLGRVASAAVQDAGEQARTQVHEGLLDSTAVGRGWANAVMSDADKRLVGTSEKVADVAVRNGGRLARRAAGWGALGLAGGLGGAAAISEGAKAARRSWERRQDRRWQPVAVRKADWKNISQRELEARNARRAKQQGRSMVGYGLLGAGAGALGGGLVGGQFVAGGGIAGYRQAAEDKVLWEKLKDLELGKKPSRAKYAARGARDAFKVMPGRYKFATALTGGGLAAIAAGNGMRAYGTARERNAERQIALMRRQRAQQRMAKAAGRTASGYVDQMEEGQAQRKSGNRTAKLGGAAWLGGYMLGGRRMVRDLNYNYDSMKRMQRGMAELTGTKVSRPAIARNAAVGTMHAYKHLPRNRKLASAAALSGLGLMGIGVAAESAGARKEKQARAALAQMGTRG